MQLHLYICKDPVLVIASICSSVLTTTWEYHQQLRCIVISTFMSLLILCESRALSSPTYASVISVDLWIGRRSQRLAWGPCRSRVRGRWGSARWRRCRRSVSPSPATRRWSLAKIIYFFFFCNTVCNFITIPTNNITLATSVVEPWHFGTDPDLRLSASDQWIRILLFSSLTFNTLTKNYYFVVFLLIIFSAYYSLKVHLHHFSEIKSHKEVTKKVGIKVFLTNFAWW